ncbi:MAG: N-acetylmuramoyl-L-alanine amidase [Clostridia bacterium]|nr:N-acetylmuramoyl-L-alanine amidase [Clostridia bacterium]
MVCVFLTIHFKRLVALLSALALIVFCGLLALREFVITEIYADYEIPILCIDPGHGGEDGGAQTAEGILESEINLDIALRLDALAGLYGVQTVMTRTSENIDYPEGANTTARRKVADQHRRVELINSLSNAALISIHQNCFPDTRPFGCQVLYARTEGSKEFGKLAHEMLCESLCPDNRRVAAPVSESIYLMQNVRCTAILVECGFLSNASEAALLQTESYRTKISSVLLAAYLQYTAQSDGMI